MNNRYYLHIIIVLIAGFLAYANSFTASFHFDDFRNITNNPAVINPHFIFSSDDANLPASLIQELKLRPIGFLSFAFNYKTGGFETFGFHVVNFLIHCFNAILIYFLVIELFKTPSMLRSLHPDETCGEIKKSRLCCDAETMAFAVSLLFMVHPIQTQAVTYIVQRFASLSTLFYLSSSILYIMARRDGFPCLNLKSSKVIGAYILSLLFAFMAVKTKENTYTISLAITLIEIFFFSSSLKRRLLLLAPFYCLLIFLPLSLSGASETFSDGKILTDMPRIDYLLTQFVAIMFYFRLLFIPYGQNLDHDFPMRNDFLDPGVIIPFIIIFSLLLLAILGFKVTSRGKGDPKIRLASFGILWFFVTISAEAGLVPIVDLVYEHRIYLPSPGFFMALIAVIAFFVSKCGDSNEYVRKFFVLAFFMVVTCFIVMTHYRNAVWKDEISLWEDCAKKSPNKARVLNTLGAVYIDAGQIEKAPSFLEKALENDPSYWAAHKNLATYYGLMACEESEKGNDKQKVLNLYGLSVMHNEVAQIIKENNEQEKERVKKLLDDIKRVKIRLIDYIDAIK